MEGNLIKMRTVLDKPVQYFLRFINSDEEINLNNLIGRRLHFTYNGQINCIACGKRTKTSFKQGFCYNCMQTAPEASESIINPELSMAQFGEARDIEWAEKHDLIEHIVYLSLTSNLKVGVTRHHQIPTRWIDQGANMAVEIARTPNRHIAGVIERFLKNYYSDKTSWQAMLKNEIADNINIKKEVQKAIGLLPAELQKYGRQDASVQEIIYPISHYPTKIKSISFDKQPKVEATLVGIKGQYLIFEDGKVLNIRKHNGYFVQLRV